MATQSMLLPRLISISHSPIRRKATIRPPSSNANCHTWATADIMLPMSRILSMLLASAILVGAAELPSKKYLNLAAVKTMVAAAEAEMQKRNVHVSICIMDENGNLLFFQRGEGTSVNTITFAQGKRNRIDAG